MLAASCISLEESLAALQGDARHDPYTASATIADVCVTVDCDDPAFYPDFFAMFGGRPPVRGRGSHAADMHLDIRTAGHGEYGRFRMSGRDTLPLDAHEFSFALQAERGIFDRVEVDEPGWTCLAFRGTDRIALAFRGRDCLFALDSRWRASVLWYLFWRLLRIRADAIFFHASVVGIGGAGTMFIGAAGGGKSTTSLALAARGHEFLSDEIGGWLPATGELIPFRRPVGIKPGPRCAAVQQGLSADAAARIERDGFLRVGIETLFDVPPPRNLPLRNIVFLRGFAAEPALRRIVPGRAEIAELQPLLSSFLNASHSRRVFDLTRMLNSARVYQLNPGAPDATACFLEEALQANDQ